MPDDLRERLLEIVRLNDVLVVSGLELLGDQARQETLIVILLLETDGESADRLPAAIGHAGHDTAGIQPA